MPYNYYDIYNTFLTEVSADNSLLNKYVQIIYSLYNLNSCSKNISI